MQKEQYMSQKEQYMPRNAHRECGIFISTAGGWRGIRTLDHRLGGASRKPVLNMGTLVEKPEAVFCFGLFVFSGSGTCRRKKINWPRTYTDKSGQKQRPFTTDEHRCSQINYPAAS